MTAVDGETLVFLEGLGASLMMATAHNDCFINTNTTNCFRQKKVSKPFFIYSFFFFS